MSTNPVAKHAVIINGDTEPRHLKNVERSIRALKAEGYTVHVASPNRPTTKLGSADRYAKADLRGIQGLVAGLRGTIDDNDELVIYTTGHGGTVKERGTLCLTSGCKTPGIDQALDALPFGRRVVVMDQCFSGNWSRRFTDDPRTLFVAAGSRGEKVCCQNFAPHFWSKRVPDANRDGVVSWQERYAYAVDRGKGSAAAPQFVRSPGFQDRGAPSFAPTVTGVTSDADLRAALQKLRPGQYAAVLFSADWCEPCKVFAPAFAAQAKAFGGQALFLRTENEALAKQYGAAAFPTVIWFDGEGHRYTVPPEEHAQFVDHLARFQVPVAERLATLRARFTDPQFENWQPMGHTYLDIAKTLPLEERVAELATLRTAFLSVPHRAEIFIAETIYGRLAATLPKPLLEREFAITRGLLVATSTIPTMATVATYLYSMMTHEQPNPRAVAAREAPQLRRLLVQSGGVAAVAAAYCEIAPRLSEAGLRAELTALRPALDDARPAVRAGALRAFDRILTSLDNARQTLTPAFATRVADLVHDSDEAVAGAATSLVNDIAPLLAKDASRAARVAAALRTHAPARDPARTAADLDAYRALAQSGALSESEIAAGGRWALQWLRQPRDPRSNVAWSRQVAAASALAALSPKLPLNQAQEAATALFAEVRHGTPAFVYAAIQLMEALLPKCNPETRRGYLRQLQQYLDPDAQGRLTSVERRYYADVFEAACRQTLGTGPRPSRETVWSATLRAPDPDLQRGVLFILRDGIFGKPDAVVDQVAAVRALTTAPDPTLRALATAVLATHARRKR